MEEALSNAVYHKGYDEREPIEVRVEPDRIIIVSHPGADRSISAEGLKEFRAYSRRYRNRRIGEFLKEMHLTEGRNTGFRKIRNALKNNGSPEPLFETDEERTYFSTTLHIHPDFDGNDGNRDGNEGSLSNNESLVLTAIKQDAALSAAKISEQIGISKPTVERVIRSLKMKGYIKREGSTRGKWVILR